MHHKCKQIVVDTGGFVSKQPLWDYGEQLITVDEVVAEIRDAETKQYIQCLPLPVTLQQPRASSVKFINEFSKKSGDYPSLSSVDVKVLALAYELELEINGSSHMRTEPIKCETYVASSRLHQRPHEINGSSTNNSNVASQDSGNGGSSNGSNLGSKQQECEAIEGFYMPGKKNETLQDGLDAEELNIAVPSIAMSETSELVSNPPTCEEQLSLLDNHLQEYSYIAGYHLSQYDVLVWEHISKSQEHKTSNVSERDISICENILRWMCHLASFSHRELYRCNRKEQIQLAEKLCHQLGVNLSDSSVSDETQTLESGTDVHQTSTGGVAEHSIEENVGEELDGSITDEGSNESGYDDVDHVSDDDNDEEDGGGWITPSNIKTFRNTRRSPQLADDDNIEDVPEVVCMTADFAMQNVLLHIGLKVIGIDGKLITSMRTHILRCFACYATTSNMTKLFCPRCGHKTLKRVAVTVNPDGTKKLWISRRPINTRGMKYSLPAPKGGKHGRMPLLVEDQRQPHQRAKKPKQAIYNPMHPDYMSCGTGPFSRRDVYSRASQLGVVGRNQHQGMYYWEQRNPNVARKGLLKTKVK